MKENGNLRCAAESLQSQISIYNQWLLRLPEGMEGEDLAGTQSTHKHRRICPRNFQVKWRITPRGPGKDTMFWTKSSARALVLGDNYKAAWPNWLNLMKWVCQNWGEKKNMQWASKWGSWSVTAIQILTKRGVLLSKAFPLIDVSLGCYTPPSRVQKFWSHFCLHKYGDSCLKTVAEDWSDWIQDICLRWSFNH